jgi:hypothetical protein
MERSTSIRSTFGMVVQSMEKLEVHRKGHGMGINAKRRFAIRALPLVWLSNGGKAADAAPGKAKVGGHTVYGVYAGDQLSGSISANTPLVANKIQIDSIGQHNSSIQLVQNGIILEEGKSYEVNSTRCNREHKHYRKASG